MLKFIFGLLLFIVVIAAVWFLFIVPAPVPNPSAAISTNEPQLLNRSTYLCKDEQTIDVALYEVPATTTPAAGQPPVVTGTAKVALSDGRNLDLKQTISADGVRYANENEDFVFWSKGNGALVLENNVEKSYINCVLVKPAIVGVPLPEAYANDEGSFSLRLPSLLSATEDGYQIEEDFEHELSPGEVIYGVKFTIPEKIATGTNLSSDTYLSVESIPNTQVCSGDLFLFGNNATSSESDEGVLYSIATSSDAAAGNRYQEKVFAIPGTNPCLAVRYMVHYTVLENYEPGAVTEFNAAMLINEFDQIRRSLVINQ